eukprot:2461045-Amphidinium_carterae.1
MYHLHRYRCWPTRCGNGAPSWLPGTREGVAPEPERTPTVTRATTNCPACYTGGGKLAHLTEVSVNSCHSDLGSPVLLDSMRSKLSPFTFQ